MKRLVKIILILCVLAALIYVGRYFYMHAAYPQKYSEYVGKYSAEYGVPENLVYAVIKCESGFDPQAISPIGAQGLMQITPDTFDWAQSKMPVNEKLGDDALYDEETNIKYGVFLLSLHLEEFSDENTALAAYHAGRGTVNNWLKDSSISEDGKVLANIPYKDTKAYVDRVEKTAEIYKELYSGK